MPYLNELAAFRDSVRKHARALKATDILKECDVLRDDVLPELGVRLEDKENEPTVIKLVDKDELLRERQQKKQQEEVKRLEKEKKKKEAAEKLAMLEAQRKIPPTEMFKGETEKYSKFDEKLSLTSEGNENSGIYFKSVLPIFLMKGSLEKIILYLIFFSWTFEL